MKMRAIVLTLSASFALGACAQSAEPRGPEVIVHKSASCNCCKLWAQQLRDAGFVITLRNANDLGPVKERLGVPAQMRSCHTGEVAGYFMEGHVPIKDIERLLRERPDAKGLAVPGMPVGSPGMESPSGEIEPYTVFLIDKDGRATAFSTRGSSADHVRRALASPRNADIVSRHTQVRGM